ncbi:hypothetical protein AA309_28005 [Microvirga vignae]|uniref:Uncharacterized protein n=1 Tax=Microvirga vignae TaxID=1225564 RepID=A0A0H1RBT4_9HYPH|nr:hypothetical protein [Microvirga vignae]KLK90067.1 hypothetical protein AA309_28005 [Microvirga vignae]
MTKPLQVEWEKIAQQYADGVSVSAIARTFNVSRARISRRAKQSGWVRGGVEDVSARTSRPAQDEPPGSSEEGREGATDRGDPRGSLMQRHRDAWPQVWALRGDAYRILKGEEPVLLAGLKEDGAKVEDRVSLAESLIAMFDRDAKALSMAQEGERRAYGIDYKQQQVTAAQDEASVRRRRELGASILSMVRDLRRRADALSPAVDTMASPPDAEAEVSLK